MSYNGVVDIGLMGDYDAMADLDDFGEDVRESIAELGDVARARAARAKTPSPAGSKQEV